MTVGSRDFPDWNRPITRLASVFVETMIGSAPSGDVVTETFTVTETDDVVLFIGRLGPHVAFDAVALVPGVAFNGATRFAFGGTLGCQFLLPVQQLGLEILTEITNCDPSDQNWEIDVVAFSGAQVDTVVNQAQITNAGGVTVPGLGSSDPIYLAQSHLMERVTLTVSCDQAHDVTLRRFGLQGSGGALFTAYDETLGSMLGSLPSTFDVPLGCVGAEVIVANTSAVDATLDVVARTYRPVGS